MDSFRANRWVLRAQGCIHVYEWPATGAIFSHVKERGATHTGCLLATSDKEMGKNGPVPSGCGKNWARLRCRPRPWSHQSLRPPPCLAQFSLATLTTRICGYTLVFAVCLGLARPLPAQSKAPAPDEPPKTTHTASAVRTPPTPEEIGDSLTARQRYQAAIAAYSKAREKTATLWNKMGIDYQMMFNSGDAMRCYKESLKLDPHNPDFLNNLATVYASLKEYGQADRMYRKALKFGPQSALILKNLGTDLLAEHKYNKGWEAYQEALAIDPQIFEDHSSPKVENPSDLQERGAMNYYMAAGCARAGYPDCALQYLRLALDEGFTTRKKVLIDIEFASLRGNPAFQQLIAEQRSQ